jgi:hypothetical protein
MISVNPNHGRLGARTRPERFSKDVIDHAVGPIPIHADLLSYPTPTQKELQKRDQFSMLLSCVQSRKWKSLTYFCENGSNPL